jgi:hypothetical protein
VKTGFKLSLVFGFIAGISLSYAEEIRVLSPGVLELSRGTLSRVSVPYNGAVLVSLGEDWRFFRGVELEYAAPSQWLSYEGSLAVSAYADLEPFSDSAAPVLDGAGRRFFYDVLPGKLRTVYQIPLREGHNLETSPYALVLPRISPASFPVLVRLVPVVKGISGELERMTFQVSAKPILGDEGAVRIHFRYPEHLPDRTFTVFIDDKVVETPVDILLKEGEHRLLVLSDDYRSENRLFWVERARVLNLDIALQDSAPLVFFEAPERAVIFLDNRELEGTRGPIPVEPGVHEVRFLVSDYSIARSVQVQKGKTYRIAITVDVDVSEAE